MDTLSSEQAQLLSWLNACQHPVSLAEMQDLKVAAFSEERVATLKKAEYLSWVYVSYRGEMVAGYYVSDKGKSYLKQQEQLRQDIAQHKADRRTDHKVAIFSSIIGAVVGSVLTLLFEHFGEVIELISSVFC